MAGQSRTSNQVSSKGPYFQGREVGVRQYWRLFFGEGFSSIRVRVKRQLPKRPDRKRLYYNVGYSRCIGLAPPNKRLHLSPRLGLGVGHFVTRGCWVSSTQKRFQNKQSLRGAGEPRAVRPHRMSIHAGYSEHAEFINPLGRAFLP